MRDKMKSPLLIAVVIIAIIAIVGIYSFATAQTYSNVTMDGVKCEVPKANITTQKVDNYQIYDDKQNNFKIVVYDLLEEDPQFNELKNTAQQNATAVTKGNLTYNKTSSGLCSFYKNYENRHVLITAADENIMQHVLTTLDVTPLKIDDILNSNDTDNSTLNSQQKQQAQAAVKSSSKASKKSSSGKSSSGGDDGYYYSPQAEDYIREYTDSNGVQHTQGKGGWHESYNPKTGYIKYTDKHGNSYSDYFN